MMILFATLCETPLFERYQKVTVVEAVVEKALGVAAFGEKPMGLRSCAAWGEG